jgi:hypothetical protein
MKSLAIQKTTEWFEFYKVNTYALPGIRVLNLRIASNIRPS